jgi:hypothetical protein
MIRGCEFDTVMGRGHIGALGVEGGRIKLSCMYEKDART